MKCVKKASEIIRVTNDAAIDKINNGWSYCSKSEWKNFKDKKSKKSKLKSDSQESKEDNNKPVSKYAQKKKNRTVNA